MRIVIRASDARAARRVQEKLAGAGFEAAAIVGQRAAPEAEDLLVLADTEGAPAAALVSHAVRPLAVLRASALGQPPPCGLTVEQAYDGALALDAAPTLLARQLRAAARTGAAEEERSRRRLTAAELGVSLPEAPGARPLKALYVGSPSPHYLWLERVLRGDGGKLVAAFSAYAGFDHLHDDVFDAVVLNATADPARALSLCGGLRRNTNLTDLPTLVLAKPRDRETATQAMERGATVVAATEAEGARALGWLFDAVRGRRRLRTAEREVRALRDLAGDARTGLFRADAFSAHLTRLAEDHHATGRPLALAVLRVLPAHGARKPSRSRWDKGFAEISSLAARLMRDTDCGASFGQETIAIAFPFTALADARRAAKRIASVAECTAFAAGENGAGPPLIFEQSVVELQPGEGGSGLLARAHAIFAPETARA